jgi:MFS transporter, DHA2 family, multidrug resistance protein
MDTTRATRREWLGLAVLALPTLLLSLDVSVLYLALPRLAADLGADSTQQLWILDIYSFMLAGFLVTMGTLGDRIGRRRLLLIGAVAFGVTSVMAAYASSPGMLIAARALLGIAGATLMPSTMALIRNMFRDPRQMASAIGIWFACFMGGMTLGPLVGGALLSQFWWGSAFLLGVPFMVLLLVVGPSLLPEYRDAAAGRFDLASVVLSLATILPVIYGLKEMARDGVSGAATTFVAAGVLVGVAFVRRQRRLANPLLDLSLFANRAFRSALGTGLAIGVVMAGVTLASTLYLQAVRGLSPLQTGMWMVPQMIAMAAGMLGAPALAQRVRPARLMAYGLLIAGAGMFLIAFTDSAGIAAVVIGLTLAGLGISPTMALTTNLLMGSTPPEKAGSAASLSETSGEFGVAMGVASLGSLATVVYRSHLSLPWELPAGADRAAREGITEALGVARELPASLAADLVDAARSAFTTAVTTVAGVGAVVFVGLAILVAAAFRNVPATAAPEPTANEVDFVAANESSS